jgi:hypothetical protein
LINKPLFRLVNALFVVPAGVSRLEHLPYTL